MSQAQQRLTDRLITWMQDHAYNAFLRTRFIGSQTRAQGWGKVQAAWEVLKAQGRYPLSHASTMNQLPGNTSPRPLQTNAELNDACQRVIALGLPPHKAREKNWDFLQAFSTIVQRSRKQDVVVDLGSGTSSVILDWLHLYGYEALYGCDLIAENMKRGHIQYSRQDLEKTSYADGFADVVTCLSVIEHGVNLPNLVKECHRLLKPGGLLILSTDYTCQKIDLTDVRDELGPVHLFTPETMEDLLVLANQHGFTALGGAEYACGEVGVKRPNVPSIDGRYTFYFAAFQRTS
jgi:SAM-dependent methyltransferase